MALCSSCGNKAGLLRSECETCEKKRLDGEKAKRAEADAAAEKERQDLIRSEHERIIKDAKNGFNCFLHRSYYVSVDSSIAGSAIEIEPFSDYQVRLAGLEGWRVVGVIPHTYGEYLKNKDGFNSVWAGGSGGNVLGAYVLMELEITPTNVEKLGNEILEYLEETV